jgi:hypothetical protein
LRGLAGGIVGREGHSGGRARARHGQLVPAGQKGLQGEHAAQDVASVHHEDRIGLRGQVPPEPQLGDHLSAGALFPHGDRLLRHQLTDRSWTEGGLDPRPVLRAQGSRRLLEQLRLEGVGQKGEVVGVELAEDLQERRAGGALQERGAHTGRHLDQRFTGLARRHLGPGLQALAHGQRLEDEGQVGRVQGLEPVVQGGQVLPVRELFEKLALRAGLAAGQLFEDAALLQQLEHLLQARLQAFVRLHRVHGLPPVAAQRDARRGAAGRA